MTGGPLDGKVALVTGASRGIGRAIALELARAGARVALDYRSGKTEARAVAAEIAALSRGPALIQAEVGGTGTATEEPATAGRAKVGSGKVGPAENVMLVQGDVSKSEEARALVARVVAHWGRLDILVNNAGINRDRTLRKLGDEEWEAVINTNLNGAFFCTSAAIPSMIEQRYGRIINISSVIGQSGNVGQSNYAAAKGGMISFTKSAALELAKYNITVNAVVPGFTATDMLATVPEDIQEQFKAKIPMGRFARPEEIARAALFLAADGDYITGHELNLNGGFYM